MSLTIIVPNGSMRSDVSDSGHTRVIRIAVEMHRPLRTRTAFPADHIDSPGFSSGLFIDEKVDGNALTKARKTRLINAV
jgi:hypothetical protein